MTTRIPPIPAAEQVGEVADLLGITEDHDALFASHTRRPPLNVLTTMARHPPLYRLTVALAHYVTNGLLPARDRELVVLRTAFHCGSIYEWSHHYHIAHSAGISDEEIAHLAHHTGTWLTHEQALLTATDELHNGSTITENTWHTLSEHYNEAELIELVMLIGEYHKIALFLNTMGTPVDPWLHTPWIPDIPTFHH